MTKLSLIVLSYNTQNVTKTCIQSIRKQYQHELDSGEFEIILVDNASEDDSVAIIKQKFNNLKIIENKKNFGFSKGCNIGASIARGQYLFFLNSDAQIGDGLEKMIAYADSDKQIGILGAKMENEDGSAQPSAGKFYTPFNVFLMLFGGEKIGMLRSSPKKITNVDWVSGAAMMIRKDLFDALHGFDENFFMYIEDMEICFRAKKKGYTVSFFPDIKVIHGHQGSSSRSFAIHNIYKGLLYFYKKHKSNMEYTIIRRMLLTKACLAILIGFCTQNTYLTTTYRKAISF